MSEKRLYDFLGSFPQGINSSVDPLLLPKGQLAFLSNGTNRGNLVRQRPNFNNITLTYDKPSTQTAFQTGLYQGWCYFNPSPAHEYLMVVVNGKLFRITVSGNSATVLQVILPDAGNSPTTPIHWLWASERWCIWNDGIQLPMLYDGVTARRSLGDMANNGAALATTAAPFTVPSSAQPVYGDVQLTGPWEDQNGNPFPTTGTILVNSGVYSIVRAYSLGGPTSAAAGYASATLNGISGAYSGGDALAPGATLSTSNKIQGCILSATDKFGVAITTYPLIQGPVFTITLASGYGDQTFHVGEKVDITTQSHLLLARGTISSATFNGTATTWVVNEFDFIYQDNIQGINAYLASTGIYYNCGGSPSYLPSVGKNKVILTLTQNFSGSVGDIIQVGSATLQVLSFNGTSVTCVMTSDAFNGQSIPMVASVSTIPTNKNYIVFDNTTNESLTQVASYPLDDGTSPSPIANSVYPIPGASANMLFPNSGVVASGILVAQAPNMAQPYQIVVVANLSGSTVTGTGSLMWIAALGAIKGAAFTYGKTSYWLELINQTDTQGNTEPSGSPIYAIPELPVGKMGVYAQGRNWMCLATGQDFIASDLVGSSSGSSAQNYLDGVLHVSQNQSLAGGGTFHLPGCGTQIRSMIFLPTLDVSLGQGPVQVLTQNTVFSCNAPVDMVAWASVASPIVTVSLIGSGAVAQDASVTENGDLFFRTPEGYVRSLQLARMDFNKWGNTPCSEEASRSLEKDDPALLVYDSMVVFSNRKLTLCQPTLQSRGCTHAALVSLNFDSLSTMIDKQPSTWEGEWTGLNFLGLKTGFFSSVERCFALTLNLGTPGNYPISPPMIELHEILQDLSATNDDGVTQVTWFGESSMLFKDREGSPRTYKRLINGEFSINEIRSDIEYQWYYRSDQNPAWTLWYSSTIKYQGAADPGFRSRVAIGMPSPRAFDPTNNRPLREGYNFQTKFVLTGYGKLTEARFAADEIPEPEFAQPV